ncbi:hypothetical protein [Paenibacillus ginsengarvi]|uniref:hypothetical protein n=1 Tax=Paenibacillus ginsengarvi TaxID=400777 RepID=UPI0011C35AA3|nr:hypothetical protein [Paenibacillus ginsengarvi]
MTRRIFSYLHPIKHTYINLEAFLGAKGLFAHLIRSDFEVTLAELIRQSKSGSKVAINELMQAENIGEQRKGNQLAWGLHPSFMKMIMIGGDFNKAEGFN